MALYADRVKDSTSITGTGAITLSGTAATGGYQTFAGAFGSTPQTVAYCIADRVGTNWEIGTGVFNGTTSLTRSTVLSSSNSGALVNFTAGTKDVFCTAPAAYLLPAGANTQIQYNNSGAFGASSNLTYNAATTTLGVPYLSATSGVTTSEVKGFTSGSLQISADQYVSVKSNVASPYLGIDGDGAYLRTPTGSWMGISAYGDNDPEMFSAYAVTKAKTGFNTFSVLDINAAFGTINLAPSRSSSTVNRIYSKVESYNEMQIGSGTLTSVSVATEFDGEGGVEVQPLLSFYGGTPAPKAAPTASGPFAVLNQVVSALNNLGLISSTNLTYAASTPVTLTYAANITPASSSKITYRMAMTGNLVINAPSGAADGDQIEFWLTASGGARTVTFSFAKIPSSSTLTSPVTIAAGTQGELMFRYDATLGGWKAARFVNGYT